jgi:hypothetical protein
MLQPFRCSASLPRPLCKTRYDTVKNTMWIEKILHGVLAVQTEIGVRYLRPAWYERVLLVWTFRHFQVLPEKVLRSREREMIGEIIARSGFVSAVNRNGHVDCCIGTIERSAPLPTCKPAQAAPASDTVFSRAR